MGSGRMIWESEIGDGESIQDLLTVSVEVRLYPAEEEQVLVVVDAPGREAGYGASKWLSLEEAESLASVLSAATARVRLAMRSEGK